MRVRQVPLAAAKNPLSKLNILEHVLDTRLAIAAVQVPCAVLTPGLATGVTMDALGSAICSTAGPHKLSEQMLMAPHLNVTGALTLGSLIEVAPGDRRSRGSDHPLPEF